MSKEIPESIRNPIKRHLSFLEELKRDLRKSPRHNKNKKWWKKYSK